jgi:hypothetical protein
MRYFVCLVLGLTIAGMIRIGVPESAAEPPVEQPLYGIGFRSWDPPCSCVCDYDELVMLSVLVEPTGIWIGTSRINEFIHIPASGEGLDWTRLEAELRTLKASGFFSGREDLEIAVRGTDEHPISHGTLVTAMATARRVGFTDIQLTPPEEIAASPYPRVRRAPAFESSARGG